MNEYMSNVTEMLSGSLVHALIGLLILVIGLFVVKAIAGLIDRVLKNTGFLYRKNKDKTVTDMATPLAGLIKAVLTIFVLMVVLQYFGFTDVLAPLKDMIVELAGAVPNVIGAGIIVYAGWIIAQIVSELAGIALAKFDDKLAEKTGNKDLKLSSFGRAFVLITILLPITVSALGVLNIPAISEPASAMIEELMAAVPNIIGAGIIILVVYVVTKFVISMLIGLLEGMQINKLPEKLGAQGMFTETFTVTRLVSATIMFFSMLAAAIAAVNVLGIEIISIIFAKIIEFGGGILVGSVILLIGNYLSTLAHSKLSATSTPGIANIARIAILGLILAMGLKAMGLADSIVYMAFGFTIGSVAIAFALAFGLGGRDAAKKVADRWATKYVKK
jgi:uncharacterized membrane protein